MPVFDVSALVICIQ